MKDRAFKQPKSIIIVAGGSVQTKLLAAMREADMIIGVDRGALWLIVHGLTPDLAIGDFDSVTLSEKKHIHDKSQTYMEFPSQKDATDLELAIDEAIRLKPVAVTIYGALGKRFDHAMAAIHLLQKLVSHNINGEIVDNFNKINIVRRQQRITKHVSYPYVSIIPLLTKATVSLEGFVYEVSRYVFSPGVSVGISNEILSDSAIIRVHQGIVLVVQSRDKGVR